MKYNIGDKVRVVNYGHKMIVAKRLCSSLWPILSEEGDMLTVDIAPETVQTPTLLQEIPKYAIYGIGAWYYEDQLELVEANQIFTHK